jgi:long-subunit fatty acid transport protein
MHSNPQSARILLLAIGCLGVAGLWAYNYQLNAAKTDGAQTAKTQCMADTNAAMLASANNALAQTQRQLADANRTVSQLISDKQNIEERNTALQKEIHHVTTHWLPPGKTKAEPQPACVFTHGFVRVYNQSITTSAGAGGMSAIAPAGSVEGSAKTTAVTDYEMQPSDIDRADILQHIGQYGTHCQNIESQLNHLLDYLEQQGTN